MAKEEQLLGMQGSLCTSAPELIGTESPNVSTGKGGSGSLDFPFRDW